MANIVKFIGISALFLLVALHSAAQSPTITPSTVNLGKVSSEVKTSVMLHNSTTKPLVITKIDADCHCTKTTYTRRPIASNDSTKITVTYTPSSDGGVFYKAIKVHTTASHEPLKFIIRGTNNQ